MFGPGLLFTTLFSSSFAIIVIERRELATLLQLSSWYLVTVSLPRNAVRWSAVCDRCNC